MKNKIIEFKDNGITVAKLVPTDAWQDNLGFYSDDSDFLQVGTWKYNQGKILAKHVHNEAPRTVKRTHEVLFVVSGSLKAKIYNSNEALLTEIIVNTGDFLILMDCGHGYEILEDGTKVLEVKNGPYLGADIDRKRF